MKHPAPVVHFELPIEDTQKLTDFYIHVFGWEIKLLGEEMGNYILATTTEMDTNGRPKEVGSINGGFYPKNDHEHDKHPSLVISVHNFEEAMNNIVSNGGKIVDNPRLLQGIGKYVSFLDPENNQLSIMEAILEK
jgi:predicted enzyme related to lactoylglutathione lyase